MKNRYIVILSAVSLSLAFFLAALPLAGCGGSDAGGGEGRDLSWAQGTEARVEETGEKTDLRLESIAAHIVSEDFYNVFALITNTSETKGCAYTNVSFTLKAGGAVVGTGETFARHMAPVEQRWVVSYTVEAAAPPDGFEYAFHDAEWTEYREGDWPVLSITESSITDRFEARIVGTVSNGGPVDVELVHLEAVCFNAEGKPVGGGFGAARGEMPVGSQAQFEAFISGMASADYVLYAIPVRY